MCISDLIRVRATARPDAVAVTQGAKHLTYRELDDRADQLASRLRASGARSEVPVALCMQRSMELVVGALGILRAGTAYVPLDPTFPTSRLAMLIEDSAVPLVVTQPEIAEQLPAGKWRTIVLDENGLSNALLSGSTCSGATDAKPDNLAYIIFTSGSTGRPKGVQITHANLLNLIGWHNHAFNVTHSDKATIHASPGFDAAVWELWPYLAAGASVHVVEDTIRTSPERLRDWMVATGITISFLPTALAESMIGLSWPAETSLRFLLTGADTLRHCPPAGLPFAFVNNYGPTECTVVATSGTVPCGAQSEMLPTIGRPIENVQAYIVDEALNRVPGGTAGELVVGGAGVGRGYLNLPELTSQQFVPDRFSGVEGARLYRTGDLARILPDGQIAFLGRKDEQIKIRGYRIEPAEITAVLGRHPAIRSGFVTAAEGSGEKRLLAYVVLAPDARLSAIELREFLGHHLPDYMVPSAFVKITHLPITTNGKVDRAALPKPTPENTLEDHPFENPQSEVETWLANFLSSLLRVSRVSRDDNFFNLGGHSLMGAQLIAKVQQTFDVELTLRGLFDHPTVREISSEIENLIQAKLNVLSDDEAQRILESSPSGLRI